mmetsp:Transcript_13137/g.30283  ORF Transcript_13137/g.30283 Transcript_13137/m.30283 type:complete len:207 (-) Transcript_13137:2890-3510(-)
MRWLPKDELTTRELGLRVDTDHLGAGGGDVADLIRDDRRPVVSRRVPEQLQHATPSVEPLHGRDTVRHVGRHSCECRGVRPRPVCRCRADPDVRDGGARHESRGPRWVSDAERPGGGWNRVLVRDGVNEELHSVRGDRRGSEVGAAVIVRRRPLEDKRRGVEASHGHVVGCFGQGRRDPSDQVAGSRHTHRVRGANVDRSHYAPRR